MTRFVSWALIALVLSLSGPGCRLVDRDRARNLDPDDRLAALLDELEENRRDGKNRNARLSNQPVIADNARTLLEIERLAFEFPRHVPTLVANGQLAYDNAQPEKAQAYLDRAIRLDPSHVEAVVVRARIAMEDGNLELAGRTLMRALDQRPNSAALRETYAAVLYFQGSHDESLEQLVVAERLGAPRARVQYHRGLIAEKRSETDRAVAFYEDAILADPEFSPPRVRYEALTGKPSPTPTNGSSGPK